MPEQAQKTPPKVIIAGVEYERTPLPCGVSVKFRQRIGLIKLGEGTIEGTWDPYERVKEDGTQP